MAGGGNDRLGDAVAQDVLRRPHHRRRRLTRRDRDNGSRLDRLELTSSLRIEEKPRGFDGVDSRADNAKRVIPELRERSAQ
jgi:hypothetical protein